MNMLKLWSKPNVEVAQIRSAKSGTFHVTDSKMTPPLYLENALPESAQATFVLRVSVSSIPEMTAAIIRPIWVCRVFHLRSLDMVKPSRSPIRRRGHVAGHVPLRT